LTANINAKKPDISNDLQITSDPMPAAQTGLLVVVQSVPHPNQAGTKHPWYAQSRNASSTSAFDHLQLGYHIAQNKKSRQASIATFMEGKESAMNFESKFWSAGG
jgi:hypothetical protein